jgi:hypothetical protein
MLAKVEFPPQLAWVVCGVLALSAVTLVLVTLAMRRDD